jgi:5-(carboxyamino)imidazole ribonucleotide mutase
MAAKKKPVKSTAKKAKPSVKTTKATARTTAKPIISIIMGSQSDYPVMLHAENILKQFNIPHEVKIVSAHRTPDRMYEFARGAKKRGIKIIIAGAGGAAHLPGMVASLTSLPVLGVPVKSRNLKGLDSLLSIVQMPGGIPVGTLAIGDAGAKNAGLLAVSILAAFDDKLGARLEMFRAEQTESIIEEVQPVKL